ncbi:MAG: transporter [Gammaproteobacteria bacterium]|nr:transporter [Gammaproteobacteria bacterium]MCZ6827777.1 transporter [Gammaproteobacteria bacterium]
MRPTVALASLIIMLAPVHAPAAPITFSTALPVGEGKIINREQLVFTRSGDDPTNTGLDVDVNSLISVLAYGASEKLALFAALPYLRKELRQSGGVRRSSEGIGDLTIFGRYTLFQRDGIGRTLRLGAIAGIKAPTGDDDESDALGRLPIPLQSGTGSWDSFVGIVVSYETLQGGLHSQLTYQAKTAANNFEAGDVSRLDVSWQRRVWPTVLKPNSNAFVYGVLEANIIHSQKSTVSGQVNNDSGGTTVFITPGIQYVSKKLILEAAVQIPVYQGLNGTALENDYIFRTGFRVNY